MRKAFKDFKLILENEIFYGVSLGWDFVSEHEWGIDGMNRKFGILKNKLGIEGRTITKNPDILFYEDKNICILTSRQPYSKEKLTPKDILSYEMSVERNGLQTAWDESNFCIATNNKEDFKYLRDLYNAFKTNNIVITFLKSELPVFSNSALSILIADRLPQKAKDEMYFIDKKALDLIEYERKIGITDLKEKTRNGYREPKYFMACSPKWICYEDEKEREEIKKKLNTKFDIRYWVNYSDDDDNYGWYTAEQIIKWLSTPDLKLKSLNTF